MKKIGIVILLFFASLCSAQFVVQNTPSTEVFESISVPSNSVAWACGYRGALIRTTNGGMNWAMASGNIPAARYMFDIWAIDSLIAVVVASNASPDNAYIYKTTNGGVNWTQTFFQTGGFINAVSFINSTTGFAMGDPVGGRWSLFRTTDAGSTWDSTGLRLIAVGAETGFDNSLFYEGTNIWFGTHSGKIYRSTNAGSNWTASQTTIAGVSQIYFNDVLGTGFAGGEYIFGSKLSKTNDGTVWVDGEDIEETNIRGFCGIKNTSTFWMGHEKNIYASTNNGNKWNLVFTLPTGFNTNLRSSRSGSYPRTIYGCTSNGKIVVGNTNTVGIKILSSKIPDNFELSQNYPNPFNPTTKINFKVQEKSFVSLKVFDVNGKEISKLVNEIINAGSYSVEFNSFSLSSGPYYYRMVSDRFVETKKMILIK